MKDILFRCSSVGNLLAEPRNKADKEAGRLSETAKTLVFNMWLKNEFGYEERVMTDDMMKGLLCEQDSMNLVYSVLGGEPRFRFKEQLKNKYIIGTPDIVLKKEDVVEDIKTSSNLRTFVEAELTKLYFAQAQAYMALTGKRKYRLIYCLVKTPEELLLNQKKKFYYQFNCDEENQDYINASMQIDHNNNLIDKLPKEKRIKVFSFDYDQSFIDNMYRKIEQAREYYKTLKL